MKDPRHLLRLALALFCLAAAVGPSGALAMENLGFMAGFDRTQLEGDEPSGFKYQTKNGFLAVAVLEFELGRDFVLSLQPGYRHSETGIGYKDRPAGVVRDSLRLKVDWLVLPVVVRIGGQGAFFATGGLDFAMGVNGGLDGGEENQAIEDLIRSVDLAALVGVGVELPAGRFRALGELRYRQGLLNVASNTAPESAAIPARFRFSSWQLQAGLLLPLGGP